MPFSEKGDLKYYFRSNIAVQLLISTDLELCQFSLGAAKLIPLREADIGRPLDELRGAIPFETILEDVKAVLDGKVPVNREIENKRGEWYRVSVMPYLSGPGNFPEGVILDFCDITHLKRTQAELQRKNAELLRLNADVETFVYGASHDLLGPLSNIQLSLSVLNEEVSDPALKNYVYSINSSVKKFVALIRELSRVGKIESDGQETASIDLNQLINEIVYELTSNINSTQVISTDFQVSHVDFSRKNLRRILYNLLDNAIKFRHPQRPPRIVVSAVREGNRILLSVKDNGIGIPADQLERVFTRYARVNPDLDGNGIGLYLARKIVDAAGGNITVSSEVGKGTIFTLVISISHRG